MTEPENFEEDLFADLYEDNDAAKASTASQVLAATDSKIADDLGSIAQAQAPDIDGNGVEDMDPQYDDDDDDVDFNLGGPTSMSQAVVAQEDTPQTPPYGTVHKASAKEDG